MILIHHAALADIRKETGPNYISREQVERKIVVVCNAAERDVTSIVILFGLLTSMLLNMIVVPTL